MHAALLCSCMLGAYLNSRDGSLLVAMQSVEQSEAGQRSFELQDCAAHLHSKLTQQAQRHNLLDHGPASGPGSLQDSPESRVQDNASEGGNATDDAAKRRAQAKARQVVPHT